MEDLRPVKERRQNKFATNNVFDDLGTMMIYDKRGSPLEAVKILYGTLMSATIQAVGGKTRMSFINET